MDQQKVEQLLKLIGEIVNADKSWQEKRQIVLAEASPDDKTNLSEFLGWFDEAEV